MRDPFEAASIWMTWTGIETDLIFNKGVELPGFAAFTLLDSDEGRARIAAYYDDLAALAGRNGCGAFLETVTWMANPDRAAAIGVDASRLDGINAQAVALARAAAARNPDIPLTVSLQVGPRGDGYRAGGMTPDEAQTYHRQQIRAGAESGADIVAAYTLGSSDEATGIVRASQDVGLPCVISFTVETDGRLADGMPLGQAVRQVDAATGGAAAGFLVNCAHPDHLEPALDGEAWMDRLRGFVANASRQSHAELDNATALDDGDPHELGQQVAEIRARFPQIVIVGGCCGTDLRHLAQIAGLTA